MKSLRRYLCVLLCLVSLLGVFSVSASAEELDIPTYQITASSRYYYGSTSSKFGELAFTPGDTVVDAEQYTKTIASSDFSNVQNRLSITVTANQDGLAKKDIKTTFKLDRVYYSFLLMNPATSSYIYDDNPTRFSAEIYYLDGTNETWQAQAERVAGTFFWNLKTTGTPRSDVQAIIFYMYSSVADEVSQFGSLTSLQSTSYLGEWDGDDDYVLTVQQPSEEATLLSGILGWIENIWNTVTDGFADMKNGITNIFNSILELPAKIWGFIEDGLKSLFVPDEQYIVDYKNKWELLLEKKLGAVWQVVDITLESWDDINSNDQQNTIDLPEVSIPLPNDETFTFGGDTVKVVPDGFEAIANLCKLACGAFCTLMFINGLRKRYDEVMGAKT